MKTPIPPSEVLQQVAEQLGVSLFEILRYNRSRRVNQARQLCAYMLRTTLPMSYQEVAQLMRRDHTSILYSVQLIEERLRYDTELQALVQGINDRLAMVQNQYTSPFTEWVITTIFPDEYSFIASRGHYGQDLAPGSRIDELFTLYLNDIPYIRVRITEAGALSIESRLVLRSTVDFQRKTITLEVQEGIDITQARAA